MPDPDLVANEAGERAPRIRLADQAAAASTPPPGTAAAGSGFKEYLDSRKLTMRRLHGDGHEERPIAMEPGDGAFLVAKWADGTTTKNFL